MQKTAITSADTHVDARRRLRRTFLYALIPAVLLAGKMAHSADVVTAHQSSDLWAIDIQPQQKLQLVAYQAESDAPAPAPAYDAVPAPVEISEPSSEEHGVTVVPNGKFQMHGLTYRQVYDSIPFSRSEYLANPSYRHDATMEFLTGIPRQSVHSTYEAQLNGPIPPKPEFLYNRYGTFGGTFGGGGGYGGYGIGGFGIYQPQYSPAFRYFLPIEYGL